MLGSLQTRGIVSKRINIGILIYARNRGRFQVKEPLYYYLSSNLMKNFLN